MNASCRLDATDLTGTFVLLGRDRKFDVLLQLGTFPIRRSCECAVHCATHALCNSYHVTSTSCELTYVVISCRNDLASTPDIGTSFYIHERNE